MNAQLAQRQRQWFDELIDQEQTAVPSANLPWLDQTRSQARQAIKRLELPHRKQEAWRYSNLDGLFKQHYRVVHEPFMALVEDDIDSWVFPRDASYRLVIANGHSVPHLSNIQDLPEGVVIGSLRAVLSTDPGLLTKWLGHNDHYTQDVFSELNRALLSDGLFVHVPRGVQVPKPIEVVYLNLSLEQRVLVQPYSLVVLQDGAQARLVERFISTGESDYFFNGTGEVVLGAHARLEHYRLQNESPKAHHLSRLVLQQDTASEYRGLNLASGGAWSRSDIHARFAGEHASCLLDGLYTVGAQQYSDFHLDVRHSLPNCRSRENFRGIVYGKGRAVFDGRILVEQDAQKTDAQLSNKNLLLVSDAEVDSKPQLEIYADDVKCSHGTTVGKIDPNQLFYLRSRGIDEHEARRMICLGFAEQILEQVDDPALHGHIHAQLSKLFSNAEAV